MPLMTFRIVVFPAPFGPINPRISPGCTSRSTSETAKSPPNLMDTFSIVSRAATALPCSARSRVEPARDPMTQAYDPIGHQNHYEDDARSIENHVIFLHEP